MDNTRIKISSIVESQLPIFVRENFPLVKEFLTEYYRSLDVKGGVYNIIQNIDDHIKVDKNSNLVESTFLISNVSLIDNVINVDSTDGFPDTYGLIKIDSEVILYKNKTRTTFEGCVRGFSAITSYRSGLDENFTFENTLSEIHNVGTENNPKTVLNLSILFLKKYFEKTKKQFLPGFEGRKFFESLNSATFLKNSKDFYSSKGTDESFKILFRVLFGKEVDVIKPRDYLIQPSDAQYRVTKNIVVEQISGNVLELRNKTIFQDEQGFINKAFGTVTEVEEIFRNGKKYYILKLDKDFNKDINVLGTIFGEFSIHPKTKIVESVSANSKSIIVDSTVGFPKSGTLIYSGLNGNFLISYEDKTLTQFINCSGIVEDLKSGDDLPLNVYAYGFSSSSQEIRFRIGGVISDAKVVGKGRKYFKNDPIKLSSFGYNNKNDFKSNNWIFNVAVSCEVESFTSEGSGYFKIKTFDNNNIKNEDFVEIDYSTDEGRLTRIFKALVSEGSIPNREFIINKVGSEIRKIFSIRKVISTFKDGSPSDVINTYQENGKSDLYITSNSLPNYGDSIIQIDDFKLEINELDNFSIFSRDHGFITGDAVVYSYTEGYTGEVLSIQPGVYYVKFINESEFKLARSKENIEKSNNLKNNSGFVKLLDDSKDIVPRKTGFSNNFIGLLSFSTKNLNPDSIGPQKLVRKLINPKTTALKKETSPGPTGIFLNGVELLNYKSNDVIFYGGIESVDVVSPGENYSILNPPELKITSAIGNSAFGYCGLEGSLERIDIIDPGFDYIQDPVVNISGGSGSGAKASVNLIPIENSIDFDSTIRNQRINLLANQVGFNTFHRFNTGEIVNYSSNGQVEILGLKSNSNYFIKVIDDFTVKLFKSFQDSIDGTNEIDIGGVSNNTYGQGSHTIKSKNKKFSIGSLSILESGSGYKNKKITVDPIGVNTSFDQIEVYEHPYRTGEILTYYSTGQNIAGVSSGSYYVTRIDDKKFKLSQIGIGTIAKDFYFKTQQYLNFVDQGSGKHVFNYEPIKISVSGYVGVSTINQKQFNSILRPIFRGSVSSIFIENSGVGYGSSDIINYNRQPGFDLLLGSGAEVIPVISEGKIEEILILNSGSNYTEPPDVVIEGNGLGAVLTPIIEEGRLKEVKVIFGGYGYNKENTKINLVSPGSGCKLKANIKKWTINNYERLIKKNKIGNDDGIVYKGLNPNYGLEYSHLYAPRKLREKLLSESREDDKIVYRSDYSNDKNITKFHSPIIGWAYDGNPIYGPYGYQLNTKGSEFRVLQMKSGYADPIDTQEGRPDKKLYPSGFFVDDYIFNSEGDLDENNGRFCVTPEFPQGTYAYFCTISETDVKTSSGRGVGIFNNDREPKFPYVIGKSFNSDPINFNFNLESNQDQFNFIETPLIRNTFPYNTRSKFSEYKFLENNNKSYKVKDSIIKSTNTSGVNNIRVISGGNNYSIGDQVIFDNEGSGGSGAIFKVNRIAGKPIQSINLSTISLDNLEFTSYRGNSKIIGFSTVPHNLFDKDNVLLNSTGNSAIKGNFEVQVLKNTLVLTRDVPAGNGVQYFEVDGALSYPSIKENDIYTVDSEKIKVLNIEKESSRIRVLREFDSTVGAAHTAASVLIEESNKISVDYPNENFRYKINREYYFDPQESIGFGTERSQKVFTNPGVGVTTLQFNPRSIYLKNHELETGNIVTYQSNGSPIAVSTDGISIFSINDFDRFYVAKLSDDFIGLSTDRVGLNTLGEYTNSDLSVGLLYFNSTGIGSYHSITTVYDDRLLVNVEKNTAIVSTASSHGLSVNDLVKINISSGISTEYKVKYNDSYRRIIVGEVSFDSADVDIDLDTIRIEYHGFVDGQKVIYNSNSPSIGLSDNQIYYIVVYDKNRIRLSSSKYDSTKKDKNYINIQSTSSGTLSPINPPIKVVKNSKLIFDLSDASLTSPIGGGKVSAIPPAFKFTLYKDIGLSDVLFAFDQNGNSKIASQTTGSSIRQLEVDIDSTFPDTFYYNLEPINENVVKIKSEVQVDTEVDFNNQILLKDSSLSGEQIISSVGLTTFSYNIMETNEVASYDISNSALSYTTNSNSSKGPIAGFESISFGSKYEKFPNITGVESNEGKGAILIPVSFKIGSVKSIEIRDIGYEYTADTTLKPFIRLPQIFRLEPLSNIKSVGISSAGFNYKFPPKLVVKDNFTNKIVEDIILDYDLKASEVKIIKNTQGFYNNIPTIIPTNNSNGFSISNITYDSINKEVSVTLKNNFSSISNNPFKVGENLIVEGVSTSSGIGYNSKNYNYSLFKITDVNLLGPLPIIKYSLEGKLTGSQIPGIYDEDNSSGTITPERYFPIFNVTLGKNNFSLKETVRYGNKTGKVVDWDSKNEVIKISTEFDYENESIMEGLSSNSNAFIRENQSFDSYYDIASSSNIENGWRTNTGFLNDSIQRIPDNDYYQYFSYSLKSEVGIDNWITSVNDLNHTVGFKKFSDLQVISSPKDFTGISTVQREEKLEVVVDLNSEVDVNCVFDFDLVTENYFYINDSLTSDEIYLDGKIIQDYSESIGNRVLLIDDISNEFNTRLPATFVTSFNI